MSSLWICFLICKIGTIRWPAYWFAINIKQENTCKAAGTGHGTWSRPTRGFVQRVWLNFHFGQSTFGLNFLLMRGWTEYNLLRAPSSFLISSETEWINWLTAWTIYIVQSSYEGKNRIPNSRMSEGRWSRWGNGDGIFCGKGPFSERVKYYTTGDSLTKEWDSHMYQTHVWVRIEQEREVLVYHPGSIHFSFNGWMSERMSPTCLMIRFIVNIFNILFYPMKWKLKVAENVLGQIKIRKPLIHMVISSWKQNGTNCVVLRSKPSYGIWRITTYFFMSSLKSKNKGKWLLANYVGKGVNRILTTSINTSQKWNIPTCS